MRTRAGSVRELVNEVERGICGEGAVRTVSMAEGHALAGAPAARLLDAPGRAVGAETASATHAAWVFHRVREDQPWPTGPIAFELVAASAQEAVDHCLVAHRMAQTLGRPGVCTLGRDLAEALHVVHWPQPSAMEALRSVKRIQGAESELDAVVRAFAETAEQLGRPSNPLVALGVEDAVATLITAELSERRIAALQKGARDRGLPLGVVRLALLRPVPVGPLRRLLERQRTILVPDAEAATLGEVGRAVLAPGASIGRLLAGADRDHPQLWQELSQLLATPVREPEPASPPPAVASFTLGLTPGGPLAEQLLLELAARLGEVTAVQLTRPDDADGPSRLSLSTRAQPPGRPEAIDVLLADPERLGPADVEAVRRGGTVVLAGDRGLRLAPAVASRLSDRGVRLRTIESNQLQRPGPRETEAARTLLQGALIGADPELGRRLGIEGSPVDRLAAEAEGPDEAERLRRGAEGLRDGLVEGEDDGEERMPLEPAAPEGQADPVWRNALREFHRTGRGAATGLDPALGRPLRPFATAALGAGRFDQEAILVPGEGRPAERVERASLEPNARSVPFDEHTLLRLYWLALHEDRRRWRTEFREQARDLAVQLVDLLRSDDRHDPSADSPSALASELGRAGQQFFDTSILSHSLQRSRTLPRMAAPRRVRIENALAELRRFLDSPLSTTGLVLFHPENEPADPSLSSADVFGHPEPLEAAVGYFDAQASSMARVFRAARVAKLEIGDDYDAERHDRVFEDFGWQAFSAHELQLLPPLVVLESALRLRGDKLGALSELLLSGRPIHVLVADPVSYASAAGSAGHPGLGYIAVAHREAFVLQSSLLLADHLYSGLVRLATQRRPALAVVALPAWTGTTPAAVQLAAAHHGRSAPCFRYDPDAGKSWAERFDLQDNPQLDAAWPLLKVRYRDGRGAEHDATEAFTFAHAAALDPAWRSHFWVIPPEAWSEDQVEISRYLALDESSWSKTLPYVRVVGADANLGRAILSRDLTFACRDRLDAWHVLQELAGADNEYVRRASERTRAEMLEQVRQEREAADGNGETTVLEEAVSQGIGRMLAALLDPDAARFAAAATRQAPAATDRTAPAAPAAASPAAAAVADVPAPAAEPAAAVVDPYIDTMLCTTCNECTNLNPQMFVYDANKQATIADRAAGTFAELVKAAEKCPARCIHPGKPRPGDKTGTEKWMTRAAPFN